MSPVALGRQGTQPCMPCPPRACIEDTLSRHTICSRDRFRALRRISLGCFSFDPLHLPARSTHNHEHLAAPPWRMIPNRIAALAMTAEYDWCGRLWSGRAVNAAGVPWGAACEASRPRARVRFRQLRELHVLARFGIRALHHEPLT